ncbi:hypothetical protein [Paucibacter sp. B51]|uniref:hypothetical protein n=1 Tax=Paucibacter sp. B51 TaxID=2993315 RepID=UPI0022EBB431|nr:hypothetical protein [Paucibacter sp. B51]
MNAPAILKTSPPPASAPKAGDETQEDHRLNTSRLSWMAAQDSLKILSYEMVLGGGPIVEILDGEDTVIGRGASLYSALDEAMGRFGS